MAQTTYTGIYPAFPTPTTSDGAVDKATLRRVVSFLIDNGANGLVPIGGTGEFTALSPRARLEVLETTLEAANGRVKVVPGVLSPGYAEAVETGQAFRKAGADALLLIAPFYVTPTQKGIRDYYKAYRNAVDLPILLYDIPTRTRIVVEPETTAGMVEDRSIVGMKACNPDINHFNHLADLVADKISILSGEDTHFPAHMAMGAVGGILATASLLPRAWADIYALSAAGKHAEAVAAQRRLLPLIDAVFAEANPGPLKTAMALVGFPSGTALSPLVPPAEATMARLGAALRNLGVAAAA